MVRCYAGVLPEAVWTRGVASAGTGLYVTRASQTITDA
jgi:hypothetical protein